MAKDHKKQSMEIFSNDALRGKPYLDIDRVIPEKKTDEGTAHRKK
ncbi:hypothetical protein [Oceanobacillus salinisoli]|nr:hypothetical protein [Oceanobacillus salinisoli]